MLAWRLLGDLAVAAHFGFLLYLIIGGFLAWRWPRTIVVHAATAIWALLIVTTKVECPLTWLQDIAREHGGQTRLRTGFIQSYVQGHLYPADRELAVQVAVATVIAVSWVGLAVLLRRRRRLGGSDARALRLGAGRSGSPPPSPTPTRNPSRRTQV